MPVLTERDGDVCVVERLIAGRRADVIERAHRR
jgi:hypothetical protein